MNPQFPASVVRPRARRGRVIFLSGPTAAGKTRLAVELAQRLPCDVISVDSAMVYRGLDIGTAKPDRQLLVQLPHRLIDICEPADSYSAARFAREARAAIGEILARGRIPLLVGGTGLYFRALERGLAPLPEADPALRAELAAEAGRVGWPALHERLSRLDPEAARGIHVHDAQRIQRALEVCLLSRRPLSVLLREAPARRAPWRVIKFVLSPAERGCLHQRIAERLEIMCQRGLLDEARSLYARAGGAPRPLPALRLVGYRQLGPWLSGAVSLHSARQRILTATRQLAKRQITWWRGEPDALWLDPRSPGALDTLLAEIARVS